MKNYLSVFAVATSSPIYGPRQWGGATAEAAQAAADAWQALDPPNITIDGPPVQFYWLLNKKDLTAVFASITDALDPFSCITGFNPLFTVKRDEAVGYGIKSPLWSQNATDVTDPAQVKALRIAEERVGKTV